MSDMVEALQLNNLTSKKSKVQRSSSTLQLTFHIPEGMKVSADIVLEMTKIEKTNVQIIKQAITDIEIPKLVSFEDGESSALSLAPISDELLDIVEIAPESVDVKIQVREVDEAVIPFFSLKLKNSPSVYKIGTTFLKDIEVGKKHFGFAALSKNIDDSHVLVYASFINYSLKKPVLIIVKDINDKAFDQYRGAFTKGTLWKWETHDWGNLCFIDYKQINQCAEEFKHVDLDFISNEFVAVLWALPAGDVQDELQKSSLCVLSKINSVTFVICSGETKSNDLKKSTAYYQCFDIPLKGVLIGESLK